MKICKFTSPSIIITSNALEQVAGLKLPTNCNIDYSLLSENISIYNDVYKCGNNSLNQTDCPLNSYCHETVNYAFCCINNSILNHKFVHHKQADDKSSPINTQLNLFNCSSSQFGCCIDGHTIAPGVNMAGCPEACNCNKIGSKSVTCKYIFSS